MNLWDPWVTWACKAKVHLCKFELCRIHPKGNLMVPCTTKYLYITISITKPYFFFAIYKWKYYHVEKYYHVASVPPLIRINNLVSLGWKVAVMWCVMCDVKSGKKSGSGVFGKWQLWLTSFWWNFPCYLWENNMQMTRP